MKRAIEDASWRAAATACLLLLTGAVLGVLADRLWLSPPVLEATPLTARGMAARLGLSPTDEARFEVLLDSLHTEIVAAVHQGPDSMRAAVRNAQHRVEAALPEGTRAGFRDWIQEQHEQLGRMHGGPVDHQTMHGDNR